MSARGDLAVRIAGLVGDGLLHITDPVSGWPALGELQVDGALLPVSLFAGSVGLSHRDRDDIERRFQNPGQNRPIATLEGRYPLLLGLFEDDPELEVPRPLLVQADPVRRIGRVTRFSVFVSVNALREASATGWSEEISTSSEIIRCFTPPLLPVSISAMQQEVVPSRNQMQAAISGSGLMDTSTHDDRAAAERARRAGTSLVRDARFAKWVIAAYNGLCAMCGLGASLVQAAHIFPASAPGSQDEAWNGLALCPNHHLAFDRHLLAVHPDTGKVVFNPKFASQASFSVAETAFMAATFDYIAMPDDPHLRPRHDMFTHRYQHYPEYYSWLVSGL
jgi:hypothetical protein